MNFAPKARFTLSPLSGLYPLNVSFDASASSDIDGQIVSYKWNFGDGDKGSGVQVQHLFQQKNFYQIMLTITDDDGATGTASAEVEVLGIYPPLNVQYQRHVNRNLFSIEYLYRIYRMPTPATKKSAPRSLPTKSIAARPGREDTASWSACPSATRLTNTLTARWVRWIGNMITPSLRWTATAARAI